MYVVILAENSKEASRHAVDQGLKVGKYRYAVRAQSIAGLKVAVIHELPGFARRRDKHAINAELRRSARKTFGSQERIVFHDESLLSTYQEAEELAHAEHAAREAARQKQLADLNALIGDELAPDEDPTEESGELDSNGAPTRQRRTRCKVCGVLVWNDNDDAHDPTMHAEAMAASAAAARQSTPPPSKFFPNATQPPATSSFFS